MAYLLHHSEPDNNTKFYKTLVTGPLLRCISKAKGKEFIQVYVEVTSALEPSQLKYLGKVFIGL
jgi:hypothetical protein